MKSPFAILLVVVVVIGIGIGIGAIFLLGSSADQEGDSDAVPVASEADFPTPSTRSESSRDQATSNDAQPEDASPVAVVKVVDEDDDSDLQDQIESGEARVVSTVQVNRVELPAGGRQGGFGGGGPGGGNFQAVQEAIANNPEIGELMQKAQSGNLSQEDQARLRELMQEALAEAGIEAPDGGQGGGFGAPPTQGTISAISGSTLTIDHADSSGLSTDIQIAEDTDITVIKELTPAELTEGSNVVGAVQRGEGGRIYIVNLAVIPEEQGQGFGGGFRGLIGDGLQGGSDATNLSNINGTVSGVNDQSISVETTQGTLRLTANEDSNIIATTSGTASDISEGMAAIAFGGNLDNTPIQPSNLIVGPEFLLENTGAAGNPGRGQRVQGQ